MSFTASAIAGDSLSDLRSQIGPGQTVLGAWDVAVTGNGYSANDPIYLSFDVGAGLRRSNLRLWHHDGTTWSPFSADDLTYNQTYASFTVTSLSGYAVVAVPEPGSLALLGVVAAGLAAIPIRRIARVTYARG